jgi:drug/metabolite transporter (DMT)-like permease
MAEISRILTAGGLVASSTGLVIYGMGASFASPRDFELTVGLWLMIIGAVVATIGIVLSKRVAEED